VYFFSGVSDYKVYGHYVCILILSGHRARYI